MKTKQEYIDVLGQMEELYYNSDNCTLAMSLFKEDIKLLTELVNEHFEEKQEIKQETNYEHYKDEIIEGWMLDLALVDGKLKRCSRTDCNECEFNPGPNKGCNQRFIEWVKKPYEKPKYKLTKFEYDLLSAHKDFKTYNNIANQIHLFKMREKGYFKDIDTNISIREILDNCEVIK